MKRLTNIFINTKENKLRLAESIFTDIIEEIKFLSDEIDWKNIKDKNSLDEFKSKYKNESQDENSIDGNFCLLIPGAIDPHVHFDTPGFEFREDFEHASTAAAYGGVTTIIDMPCTSIPPVTGLKNFNTKLNVIRNRSLIDFAFWGGVRRQDFDDLQKLEKQVIELSEAGVAGYKVYVISGMEEFSDLTYEQIEQAAQIIKQTGKPMAVHAEDKSLVISRREAFRKENKNSWKEYCIARDVEAERKAIEQIKNISEKTGCRIHVVHLSSRKGMEIIRTAAKENIKLSSETCPHYLHFTQGDFENVKIRNFLKTAPPVKFEEDKNELWSALKNNELEFVTTDHAGCNPIEEKQFDNFWKVYGGIPGVEHRVPFLFSEGFMKNRLTLEQTIKLLSTNAAKFFNLADKGELSENKDSDFTLIDLWNSQIISAENMHSKGKYTPFEDVTFCAVVKNTYLRGEEIMNRANNTFGKIGYGKFVEIKT
ncbi:MAG: amidohydrolase family protein [Melioribacteraceae bacterium]|nr:amidohydrolase family protein [Melioribacteraceae bacterium]